MSEPSQPSYKGSITLPSGNSYGTFDDSQLYEQLALGTENGKKKHNYSKAGMHYFGPKKGVGVGVSRGNPKEWNKKLLDRTVSEWNKYYDKDADGKQIFDEARWQDKMVRQGSLAPEDVTVVPDSAQTPTSQDAADSSALPSPAPSSVPPKPIRPKAPISTGPSEATPSSIPSVTTPAASSSPSEGYTIVTGLLNMKMRVWDDGRSEMIKDAAWDNATSYVARLEEFEVSQAASRRQPRDEGYFSADESELELAEDDYEPRRAERMRRDRRRPPSIAKPDRSSQFDLSLGRNPYRRRREYVDYNDAEDDQSIYSTDESTIDRKSQFEYQPRARKEMIEPDRSAQFTYEPTHERDRPLPECERPDRRPQFTLEDDTHRRSDRPRQFTLEDQSDYDDYSPSPDRSGQFRLHRDRPRKTPGDTEDPSLHTERDRLEPSYAPYEQPGSTRPGTTSPDTHLPSNHYRHSPANPNPITRYTDNAYTHDIDTHSTQQPHGPHDARTGGTGSTQPPRQNIHRSRPMPEPSSQQTSPEPTEPTTLPRNSMPPAPPRDLPSHVESTIPSTGPGGTMPPAPAPVPARPQTRYRPAKLTEDFQDSDFQTDADTASRPDTYDTTQHSTTPLAMRPALKRPGTPSRDTEVRFRPGFDAREIPSRADSRTGMSTWKKAALGATALGVLGGAAYAYQSPESVAQMSELASTTFEGAKGAVSDAYNDPSAVYSAAREGVVGGASYLKDHAVDALATGKDSMASLYTTGSDFVSSNLSQLPSGASVLSTTGEYGKSLFSGASSALGSAKSYVPEGARGLLWGVGKQVATAKLAGMVLKATSGSTKKETEVTDDATTQ